jgi:hypothetical protein
MQIPFEQDSLLGGVNQQPHFQKPGGVLLAQENMLGTLTDGLRRRPPAEHSMMLSSVAAPVLGTPLGVLYQPGPSERYLLLLGYRSVRAFDLFSQKELQVKNQAGALETSFAYLDHKTGAGITLRTPEGLIDNTGSVLEDPATGAPAAGGSWRLFRPKGSGVGSANYANNVSTAFFSPGPVGGTAQHNSLTLIKGVPGSDVDALFYYRFIATNNESVAFNKFARAGFLNVFSVDVSALAFVNQTPNFDIGFYDATGVAFHSAKFTISGGVIPSLPISTTGSIVARAVWRGDHHYRVTVIHRSPEGAQLLERRPFLYLDAPPADTQGTRILSVTGAVLQEIADESEIADFWETPLKAVNALALKSYTLLTNAKKTAAMSTATSGHAMRVVFTGAPDDDATIFITKGGELKSFRFDSTAVAVDADPLYVIDTSVATTAILAAAAFAADVNTAFGAGTARVVVTAGTVDLFGVQSVTELGDVGNEIAIHTLNQAFLWVRDANYLSHIMVRFKQGANFLKAAVLAPKDITAALTYVKRLCFGYTPPDLAGAASEANARDVCEKDALGGTQLYERGVYFGVATGGLPGQTAPEIATEIMATELAFRDLAGTELIDNGIKAQWSWAGSHTVEVVGSVIRLASSLPFDDIQVVDSIGGDGFILIHGEVDRDSDLPKDGPCQDGYVVRVLGVRESNLDDSYAVFRATTPGAFGPGRWVEGLKDDTEVAFDPATMPHQVVRKQAADSTVYFEYGPFLLSTGDTWSERTVGDETLHREPSFVDDKIEHAFLYQGRLGFLSGQNFILSASNLPQKFWRTTIQQLLNTDRIDTAIGSEHAFPLRWAIQLGRLLLLGDRVQVYAIPDIPTGVSPATIERQVLLRINSNEFARPVAYGRSAFFAFDHGGGFTGIREIFPSGEGESAQTDDSTAAVPAYIKGQATFLAFSTEEGILSVGSDGDRTVLTVMVIQETGGKRAIQSWSRFHFGGANVHWAGYLDSDLFVITERDWQFSLQKIGLRSRAQDTGFPWMCHLDRRVSDDTPGFTKVASGGGTLFRLPYKLGADETPVVVKKTTGTQLTVTATGTYTPSGTSETWSTVTISENMTAAHDEVWVGVVVSSSFTLKTPYRSNPQDGREVSQGRLQLISGDLVYEDSLGFSVTAQPRGGKEVTKTFAAPYGQSSVPRELATNYFILTGVPNDGAQLRAVRTDDVGRTITFQAGGGAETATAFFVNTTGLTLAQTADALAEKLTAIFGLPATATNASGRSVVALERSGPITFSEVSDPANEIALEVGPPLERGQFSFDCQGEASEMQITIDSVTYKPFAITKVEFSGNLGPRRP